MVTDDHSKIHVLWLHLVVACPSSVLLTNHKYCQLFLATWFYPIYTLRHFFESLLKIYKTVKRSGLIKQQDWFTVKFWHSSKARSITPKPMLCLLCDRFLRGIPQTCLFLLAGEVCLQQISGFKPCTCQAALLSFLLLGFTLPIF